MPHETTHSPRSYVSNLLDDSDVDDNESNANHTSDYDNDADEEYEELSTDDNTSPPLSPRTKVFVQAQPNPYEVLPAIPEEDGEQQLQEEDSGEAVRVPVIQHDGCCAAVPPPRPRDRLGARSLPGRSIENRNLTVDIPHPRGSRSIPGRLAHTGEVIRYFTGYMDGDEQVWLQATVQMMFLTVQRQHPTYYNVVNERGQEVSLELLAGVGGWQILRGEEWEFVDDGERRPA